MRGGLGLFEVETNDALRMFRWCSACEAFHHSMMSCSGVNYRPDHIARVGGYTVKDNVPGAWYVMWDRERSLAQASHVGPHTPAAPDPE